MKIIYFGWNRRWFYLVALEYRLVLFERVLPVQEKFPCLHIMYSIAMPKRDVAPGLLCANLNQTI